MTNDTLGRLIKLTALNPAITLPLILLARYTAQGSALASQHSTAFKHLKTLVGLGLLNSVSSWLSDRVVNNWSSDTYVWSREVVVVTGGSDGIGKIVVHLLAEKGIKVAVLDVQPLTYEGMHKWILSMLMRVFWVSNTNPPQHHPQSATSPATSPRHRASNPQPLKSAPPSATPPSSSTMQASHEATPSSNPPRKTSTSPSKSTLFPTTTSRRNSSPT